MQFMYFFKGLFFFVSIFLFCQASTAQVSLDKTRLLLTDKNKRSQLNALNATADFQNYRVSFVDMAMNESGQLLPTDDFGYSAKKFLRIGPRIGKNIPPSNTQKFRVMLRKKPEVRGEYRTHISLETLVPVPEDHKEGVLVQANFRYLIPVIVRHGKLKATAKILNARLNVDDEGNKNIGFILARTGERSIYGDVDIIDPSTNHIIKKQKGFGVYPELGKAKFTIEVNEVELPSKIVLRFSEDPNFNNSDDAVISEVEISL